MHHGINYTTRHRYLGTSSHSPRPRSAVYLGSRRITVHYRGNPVPSRQNHDRPQGQAHSTALRIPLPDILSHGTTIPDLRLGVPGSNLRSKALGLPLEMRKTLCSSYHRPCEPDILPTPTQNRTTHRQIYWQIQTIQHTASVPARGFESSQCPI